MPITSADLKEILKRNRRHALRLAQKKGVAKTRAMLLRAQRDLEVRIRRATARIGADAFTPVQMQTVLEQIKQVSRALAGSLQSVILDVANDAAVSGATHTIDYLKQADFAFRGVVQPLALNEAAMFDRAIVGARASILRRLATAGSDHLLSEHRGVHRARMGILQRYGMLTIEKFEEILQQGVLTKAPVALMRQRLIDASPFLQGAPKFWAERIVRTEVVGAYNRASWESTREAADQLGDVVKILAATFDNRTAADSYAVHGQIRRPDEAFESWTGLYQHPPGRPNDREVVIIHRLCWPIPAFLQPKTDAEVRARWEAEQPKKPRRDGKPRVMPPRPPMSTIDRSLFGNENASIEERRRRRGNAAVQPSPLDERGAPLPRAAAERVARGIAAGLARGAGVAVRARA